MLLCVTAVPSEEGQQCVYGKVSPRPGSEVGAIPSALHLTPWAALGFSQSGVQNGDLLLPWNQSSPSKSCSVIPFIIFSYIYIYVCV